MFQITEVNLISKNRNAISIYSFNLMNLDTDNIKQRIQRASAYYVTHFMISTPHKQFSA